MASPSARVLKVEDYLDYETVADPRLSPDGTQVVYTRRWVNRMEDRMDTALWIVGAGNVIASCDCGFGGRTHPQIAWAKLRALSEGAALASRALSGSNS